ncbi:MAG: PASTA domain-containing protein [Saprospirales bacterium]|nr:MAG: PASTA domain-containing protein [Saprospirales bacterium]
MDKSRKVLLLRVFLVALGFTIFALAIAFQLIKVSLIEGAHWSAQAERLYLKTVETEGDRGDILSENGLPLATSLQFFDIRMDLNTQALDDRIFFAEIDSLAWYLSRYVDRSKSTAEYRNFLIQRRRAGERYLLLKRNATFDEMKMISQFPILRRGQFRGGLIVERKSRRVKPFRSLASRTIGLDRDNAPNVGLEAAFDEYLRGERGERTLQRISGANWIPVGDLALGNPARGADVVTTINTDIQDVVHNTLLNALKHHNAKYGVAVVMRTQTGEIVAISNLERQNGVYIESYNHAIGSLVEPGSLFKLASVMALLEDGLVDVDEEIDINRGRTTICNRTVRDSEPHEYTRTSFRHSFEISSNVGVARVVNERYRMQNREADFISRLRQFGLDRRTEIELSGEADPYIKEAGNRAENWSCLSLPWMSFGYELSMTPLQLLTFFNAVANNGKAVRPYLVSELRRDGRTIRSFRPTVLNPAIASEATIGVAQELLKGVVENGTGRRIKSEAFEIAGKTGTTQLNYTDAGRERTVYQASFAGYFPAEAPEYTAIVMISEPSRNGFYGGTVAAPVFREIADKIRAINPDRDPVALKNAGLRPANVSFPYWQVGQTEDLRYLFNSLGWFPGVGEGSDYSIVMPDEELAFSLNPRRVSSDVMPNVVGMGLRDALYVLERKGLEVRASGYGRVVRQSVPPGSGLNHQSVEIVLDL